MYLEKNMRSKRITTILNAKNQFLAASVVFLLTINYGIYTGWSSPASQLLMSDKSPLPTGKVTIDEMSWIVSMLSIGSLLGNFLFGFAMNWFGRKWPMTLLAVPAIGSWFLIAFAQNVYYLYIARFVQGLVHGGALMTVPVYFVEIANDDVRGILSSLIAIGSGVGILIAYTLGNYFSYFVTPIFALISLAVFAALFPFIPETPMFLVRQNRIMEAEKSLRFYRKIPENDDKYILSEIEKLKSATGALRLKQNIDAHLQWSDFTTKSGKRAMIIATVLLLLAQLGGSTALLYYASTIFEASGSALSPNTSAMIVGIVKLFGTFGVISLVDIAGRRFLYITSCIGTAAAEIVIGVYMMLQFHEYDIEAYNWIPIVAGSSAFFLFSLAITSLPVIVTAEVMPEKIKDFGLTYANTLGSIAGFIVLKFLPTLSYLVGFHGCMFFFATICLSSAIYLLIFLPETKGKSYEEIMNSVK